MIPPLPTSTSDLSSQGEKRPDHASAFQHLRPRSRNEAILQQRLQTREEWIQRQKETISALINQREYYRAERDYFRHYLHQFTGHMPARPPSPPPVPYTSFSPPVRNMRAPQMRFGMESEISAPRMQPSRSNDSFFSPLTYSEYGLGSIVCLPNGEVS